MNGTPLTLGLVGLVGLAALVGGARGATACFEDEGIFGGHWGRAGSGVFVTDGSRVLLLLRSASVHAPGVWGIPGGAIPVLCGTATRRGALDSALNEAQEEMGGLPAGILAGRHVHRKPDGFTFTTFVWKTTPRALDAFRPILNWEHEAWKLFPIDAVPADQTHPGVLWVLRQRRRLEHP